MSLTAIYGYKWKLELFSSKTYNGQDNAIRDKGKKNIKFPQNQIATHLQL